MPSPRPRRPPVLVIIVALLTLVAVAARPLISLLQSRTSLPATAQVARVIDGDTFVASWSGHTERIRVIGANTPELHVMTGGPIDCYGGVARDFVERALTGQHVRLTAESEAHDRYGRTLADVRVLDGPLANRDLAHELVARGYARILPIAPNIWRAHDLETAQRAAIENRLGLWKTCSARH